MDCQLEAVVCAMCAPISVFLAITLNNFVCVKSCAGWRCCSQYTSLYVTLQISNTVTTKSIQTGHVVSCVTTPVQQSCCCPCLSSPAERPGTSLHLHGPSHTALSSQRPPAHKMAAWPLLPGSHSAPWPLSDCQAPHSAAPPAAQCPESGSCTSPAARRLWPREKKVAGKNFCY